MLYVHDDDALTSPSIFPTNMFPRVFQSTLPSLSVIVELQYVLKALALCLTAHHRVAPCQYFSGNQRQHYCHLPFYRHS